jgi:sulfur relay (sulfurtransferase) DsrC/TusE family protein
VQPQVTQQLDNSDRDVRVAFMRIDAEATNLLREFWSVVEPVLPGILDGFYKHVTTAPKLAALVGDQAPRLKKAQSTHWHRLFTSGFDAAYVESVRSIGIVHNRIGLKPRWYIGGYNFVLNQLVAVAVKAHRWSPAKITAVIAALNSGMSLSLLK